MKTYSVKELSRLAQVSVRTLHHYDQIGLLRPAQRSDKGYRIYAEAQLIKLQQILFYREMDIPLKEIGQIINNQDFDVVLALEFHKEQIKKRANRLQQLLGTINKTIENIKSEEKMMGDNELYSGFNRHEVKNIKDEVIKRWGRESLEETERRIREEGKKGWKKHRETDEEIKRLLASMIGFNPADIRVQKVILRHFHLMNLFYEVSKERYRALGKMYIEDERFTKHYEKYGTGLAEFIHKSIEVFCENDLKVIE